MKSVQANRSRLCLRPFLALMILLLAACRGPQFIPPSDSPKLPAKVTRYADQSIVAIQARLEKQGVKVISIGQEYLLSIPSAYLFANQSPNLTWGSYGILNEVVCYLQQFRKVAINVTGYSSKYRSSQREKALTLTRARAVGDYLWSQGIDSRFIFTSGAGSDKPIMSLMSGGDKSANSRIEITFRRAIV